MTTPPLETRVQVTDPTGRSVISRDPMYVLLCRYAPQDGYRLREVAGYDTPDGFRIVDRPHIADQGEQS